MTAYVLPISSLLTFLVSGLFYGQGRFIWRNAAADQSSVPTTGNSSFPHRGWSGDLELEAGVHVQLSHHELCNLGLEGLRF